MFRKSFRIDSRYILVARVDQICILSFGTPGIFLDQLYHKSSNKRLDAYLIFEPQRRALIQGGRLFDQDTFLILLDVKGDSRKDKKVKEGY